MTTKKQTELERLTPAQVHIFERFLANDTDYCYSYAAFESDGFDRATLKTAMTDLRERGYVQYERGLMTEEGEVAGSGFGIVSGKVAEIEKLMPPHVHKWRIMGKEIACVGAGCYECLTLEEALAQAKAEGAREGVDQAIGLLKEAGYLESEDVIQQLRRILAQLNSEAKHE
jgi:hypothetical protein